MEDNLQDYQTRSKVFFNKPSLILRIKSTLFDTVVIIILMYLMTLLLESMAIQSGNIRAAALVLVFLYEPILVTFGGTIGQRILGLAVRRFGSFIEKKQKKNINLIMSILRYITKIFLGWLSLLTIHSNHYGQAIHDKIGGSIMTLK